MKIKFTQVLSVAAGIYIFDTYFSSWVRQKLLGAAQSSRSLASCGCGKPIGAPNCGCGSGSHSDYVGRRGLLLLASGKGFGVN